MVNESLDRNRDTPGCGPRFLGILRDVVVAGLRYGPALAREARRWYVMLRPDPDALPGLFV